MLVNHLLHLLINRLLPERPIRIRLSMLTVTRVDISPLCGQYNTIIGKLYRSVQLISRSQTRIGMIYNAEARSIGNIHCVCRHYVCDECRMPAVGDDKQLGFTCTG